MNQTPNPQQPTDTQLYQPYYNPSVPQNAPMVSGSDATTLLILGIVAIALFEVVPLAGFIVGLIGCKKVKELTAQGVELNGKAKVGATLAKIGMIVCLVTTIISAVIIGVYLMFAFIGFLVTLSENVGAINDFTYYY